MANEVEGKALEQVRGRPFAKGRSGNPAAVGSARATGRRLRPKRCSRAKPRR